MYVLIVAKPLTVYVVVCYHMRAVDPLGGVSMSSKSGRIQTGATLPPDLVERLRKAAERNGRTIGMEMEIAVRQYLDDEEQLPPELIAAVEKWYRETVTATVAADTVE